VSNSDVFIFEVSQKTFQSAVIDNSHKLPVLVEFMGVWSGPCIAMADNLAKLATEFAGDFIFAKVDIDEQPELKAEYKIENVPTLKVFKDGDVVKTEYGIMQDDELRELLKQHDIYNRADDIRLQARNKHLNGETSEAIVLLTQAIQQSPGDTKIAMDMVQIFLDINELEQAKSLFNRLPNDDKKSDMGNSLLGQLTFRDLAANTKGKETLLATVEKDANNLDAHFDLAICYVAEHHYQQAVDHLFVIFNQNPGYKEEAAKEMIINLSNMLSENEPELAKEFRQRLASEAN